MKSSRGSWGSILPRRFYARDASTVAQDLLGAIIVHRAGGVTLAGRIVEVEAYLGVEDLAAHASRGLTNRTRVPFRPPGHRYVYANFRLFRGLKLVAEPEGRPGGVLFAPLDPLAALDAMPRRGPAAKRPGDLASGPGKLTPAMAITRRHNGQDVTRGPLVVRRPAAPERFDIAVGPRIGITHCADWPLRFYIQESRFVSC